MGRIFKVLKAGTVIGIIFTFLVGCTTTVAVRQGRAIERTGGNMFTRTYKQDGKNVDLMDMFEKLGKVPTSSSKISAGKYWLYGSLGLAAIGGYYLGQGIVSSGGQNSLLTGSLFVGLGVGGLYLADKDISEAVDAYNHSVGGKRHGFWNFDVLPKYSYKSETRSELQGLDFFATYRF